MKTCPPTASAQILPKTINNNRCEPFLLGHVITALECALVCILELRGPYPQADPGAPNPSDLQTGSIGPVPLDPKRRETMINKLHARCRFFSGTSAVDPKGVD